jgi:hypothetical protein
VLKEHWEKKEQMVLKVYLGPWVCLEHLVLLVNLEHLVLMGH